MDHLAGKQVIAYFPGLECRTAKMGNRERIAKSASCGRHRPSQFASSESRIGNRADISDNMAQAVEEHRADRAIR
jgi:hypothetical protein